MNIEETTNLIRKICCDISVVDVNLCHSDIDKQQLNKDVIIIISDIINLYAQLLFIRLEIELYKEILFKEHNATYKKTILLLPEVAKSLSNEKGRNTI